MTQSLHRRAALVGALATVTLLGACATASGPRFTSLDAAAPEHGQLYLYRKSALYASAAAFEVSVDGKPAGKLFNASYLVLPVSPGEHDIKVAESIIVSKSFKLSAEAGKRYFAEYDASKGWLIGWGALSGSAMKSEEQALADLKTLKRAQ